MRMVSAVSKSIGMRDFDVYKMWVLKRVGFNDDK